MGAGPGTEGERTQDLLPCDQRMAGIGLDATRSDQLRPGVGNIQDIIGYDLHPVTRDATGDGHAVIKPLDFAGFFFGDAGAGVEVEPARLLIHQEVETGLAVQVHHDRPAQFVDDFLRIL